MRNTQEERPRCAEYVYVRDTYRVHRQGGLHFKMHYARQQCSRKAQTGRDYCWQHPWANPPARLGMR